MCLALHTVSCQNSLRWTWLAQPIPDNSVLYMGMGHLHPHAPVSNELRDNRHKWAQMKLPYYSLWLMSFEPPLLHPSSVSPSGAVFDMCDMWKKKNVWCPHTHTNNHRVHGRTMMLHTLSVLSTHTPPFKFRGSQSLSFAALEICCHHWH